MSRPRPNIALLMLLLLLPLGSAAERTVVLVTGESCPIDGIDSIDVRKAYLGIAVTIDDYRIRPLRLSGDEQLDQVFFQSIVAMSHKSYERRVLSLALKFGTPRPMELDDLGVALELVRSIECSVVYAWSDDVIDETGIKILRPLWHGQ